MGYMCINSSMWAKIRLTFGSRGEAIIADSVRFIGAEKRV
jgi:hypothetical protein